MRGVDEQIYCFFFKQKTAYEMRISDWSSDVCSSDLATRCVAAALHRRRAAMPRRAWPSGGRGSCRGPVERDRRGRGQFLEHSFVEPDDAVRRRDRLGAVRDDDARDRKVREVGADRGLACRVEIGGALRSEEPTSELQPLKRI